MSNIMGQREILTLQFGHYSNYVGTHWWNIQEQGFEYGSSSGEINHDVLYREGLTQKNEVTFTPRLLLVDLQDSLKTLPEIGELYSFHSKVDKDADVEWDQKLLETKKEPMCNKNRFQKDLENSSKPDEVFNKVYDFEKEVSVWSDFLYARFHPKSINILKEYQHCNKNTPFELFPLGADVWKSPQFEEEFSDKIRSYIEECDSFQGFHILTDCVNAFAGMSSSCMQYLKDYYDRKPVVVFPVIPSDFPDSLQTEEEKCLSNVTDSIRVLNIALGFSAFGTYSSLYVPLSTGSKGWRHYGSERDFSHVLYNHELPYHSSAILASALDTFTLKYRLKSTNSSMIDLCTDLSYNGRKAAGASLNLPFSFNIEDDLLQCLDNWQGPLAHSISPNCEIGLQNLMQYVTLRGIPEEKLKRPLHLAKKELNSFTYKCNTITEMLNLYLAYSTESTISNVTVVYKSLDVKTPYPRIFDDFVGQNGYINRELRPRDINVQKVPVFAGLHSGPGVGDMLESLYAEARRINFSRLHHFSIGGVEKDEFEESLENILSLQENYTDNYCI